MNTRTIAVGVTVFVALVTGVAAMAQQRVVVGAIGPAPPYPANGQIPEDLKNQFVFIDYATHEVVVSYPDVTAVGGRRVVRFDRADQVEPVLTSAVSAGPAGVYTYKYTLQNGPSATRPLKSLSITVPKDSKIVAQHPVWSGGQGGADIGQPGALRPETLLTWTGATTAVQLAKGQAVGGFQAVTALKPGLVIAFAEAAVGNGMAADKAAALPEAVQAQLSQVLQPQWNMAQTITIGPKFAPSDPKSLVAFDFHAALKKLSILGGLNADSPFVTGALAALVSYMSAPEGAPLAIEFLEKAAPGLESEIAAAMRISFQ
jgi:hypothetical protein